MLDTDVFVFQQIANQFRRRKMNDRISPALELPIQTLHAIKIGAMLATTVVERQILDITGQIVKSLANPLAMVTKWVDVRVDGLGDVFAIAAREIDEHPAVSDQRQERTADIKKSRWCKKIESIARNVSCQEDGFFSGPGVMA